MSADLLDDRGLRSRPQRTMMIDVLRHYQQPEWVSLLAYTFIGGGPFDYAETTAPYPAGRQREWAEFVKAWVTRSDACYAHVSDDALANGGSALEAALYAQPQENVPRSCEVLRGYSWVTVCAPGLAARLGGTQALGASGAFDEVTELPAGQVFLRATPAVQDFEGARLRLVFETLAPVMLPGRPRAMDAARLVMDADAAQYQQGEPHAGSVDSSQRAPARPDDHT
jgi:hypothetical protein